MTPFPRAHIKIMTMKRATFIIFYLSGLLLSSSAFSPSPPRESSQISKSAFAKLESKLHAPVALYANNQNDDGTPNVNRRSLISLLGLGSAGALNAPAPAKAASTGVIKGPTYQELLKVHDPNVPMADLPMIRLHLPGAGVGRDYIAIQLKVENEGPFDFMIDSGLTTELITPHLQQSLGIGDKKSNAPLIQGLGAGGSTQGGQLVKLDTASLYGGRFPNKGQTELNLPPLYAIVTDFPQAHIDPNHNVEGMLGMEMLDVSAYLLSLCGNVCDQM